MPSRSGPGPKPVFVDPAGRRARWVAIAGRLIAVATIAYLGLVVASLVGAPWVPRLALPSVGPAPGTIHAAPAVTLPPSAERQPAPALTRTTATTVPAVTSTAPGNTVPGAKPGAPVPVAPVTTAPPAAPGTTAAPPGQVRRAPTTTAPASGSTTTAPPGHSGTSPGKTR